MCVFSMLAAIMFISKIMMEALPNIHLVGVLTIAYTAVYRGRALIPIYIYVLLEGVFSGFNFWWLPYTYIWTILWALTMLLPKNTPRKVTFFIYPILCALHGLAFGILYAPAQAMMFGLTREETVAWILSGLTFDTVHAVSNLVGGMFILPLVEILRKLSGNHIK